MCTIREWKSSFLVSKERVICCSLLTDLFQSRSQFHGESSEQKVSKLRLYEVVLLKNAQTFGPIEKPSWLVREMTLRFDWGFFSWTWHENVKAMNRTRHNVSYTFWNAAPLGLACCVAAGACVRETCLQWWTQPFCVIPNSPFMESAALPWCSSWWEDTISWACFWNWFCVG